MSEHVDDSTDLTAYLESLEEAFDAADPEAFYLWPRTPMGHDHQEVIARRMGVSDLRVDRRESRPAMIIRQLERLLGSQRIPEDFSLLDIACGDAIVLHQISRAFPRSRCFGIDCNRGLFGTHAAVEEEGVKLFRGYIQHLVRSRPSRSFDIVLMLNTYRGWQSADLRESERDLPQLTDAWLTESARFVFLTATGDQIDRLRQQGWHLSRLGAGEDDSTMVCLSSREEVPVSIRGYAMARLASLRSRWPTARNRIRRRLARVVRTPWRATRKLLGGRGVRHLLRFGIELPLALLAGRVSPREAADYAVQLVPKKFRRREPLAGTTYVFAFLGEFGYELLNWQGVVRRFAACLSESSEVVIAGRRGLERLYESASRYIEISDLPAFRESVAVTYFGMPPYQLRRYDPPSWQEIRFDQQLRSQIQAHVLEQLDQLEADRPVRAGPVEFVFSSQRRLLGDCDFGVDRHFHWGAGAAGSIYDGTLLANNEFRRIEADLGARAEIEAELGFSLEEAFVLTQGRRREMGPQVGVGLPLDRLTTELARSVRVVHLSFSTGRLMDSGSEVEGGEALTFQATSFRQQSCLIHFARICVFTSEGDLGSHTYLPPLLGRDVVVVASADVFAMQSAPVEFWNEYVFRFGGQMIPWPAEEVLRSEKVLRDAVRSLSVG